MNRNFKIAAAIVAALSGSAAFAQAPSIATINATPATNTINIMGSSAIKAALTNAIKNNFCGSQGANATVITSNGTNSNFLGIACTPTAAVSFSGNYNVWIRYEGGSVSGYLPMVNTNNPLNEISGAALTANPITINGASTGNGVDDSFTVSAGGALTRVIPDLGIGDVEPAALIGSNYPSAYSTTVFGANNAAGLYALGSSGLVDEVYAVYVNENSSVFSETPLSLNTEMVNAILTHKIKNWSLVTDVNGNKVAGSLAITIVNRETGSGSRAATDILVVGDGCGSAGISNSIFETAGPDYFSTGDVLSAASTLPGSITYATIDNSKTNMYQVALNGVTPSNLAAAQGTYPFWVEAQYINNAANTGADATAINSIVASLQTEGTTASLQDVNAIPAISGAAGGTLNTPVHAVAATSGTVPTGGGNGVSVYINPFTRHGHTCSAPVDVATVQ